MPPRNKNAISLHDIFDERRYAYRSQVVLMAGLGLCSDNRRQRRLSWPYPHCVLGDERGARRFCRVGMLGET